MDTLNIAQVDTCETCQGRGPGLRGKAAARRSERKKMEQIITQL